MGYPAEQAPGYKTNQKNLSVQLNEIQLVLDPSRNKTEKYLSIDCRSNFKLKDKVRELINTITEKEAIKRFIKRSYFVLSVLNR